MIHRFLSCMMLLAVISPCVAVHAQEDAAQEARKAKQAEARAARQAARGQRANFKNPDPVTTPKVGPGLWVASTGHSLVRPSVTAMVQIAPIAGLTGHVHIAQLSGGATGSPASHWVKPEPQQTAKRALATGKVDVLTLGWYPGTTVEDISKWIDLALEKNTKIRVYIQDAWPSLDNLLPEMNPDADPTYAQYFEAVKGLDQSMAELTSALNEKYAGRVTVYVIPVSAGMAELVRLYREGKLSGIEKLHVPKTDPDPKPTHLYRDWIHPSPPVAALEGYLYYACLYGKNPAELSVGIHEDDEKLDKTLRQVAWKAATSYPLSGVRAGE